MKNNNSIYFLFLIAISHLTYAMMSDTESDLPITCEIFHCNQKFQYLDDLESHLRAAHSIAISTLYMDLGEELVALLKAPRLKKQYTSDYDEDTDDSKNSTFRCNVKDCDKIYTHLHSLNRHLLSHSEERPFKCDECGKGFKFDFHLKGHAKVHQEDYPYSCKKCESAFKRTSDLNKHLKEVHANGKQRKRRFIRRSLAQ